MKHICLKIFHHKAMLPFNFHVRKVEICVNFVFTLNRFLNAACLVTKAVKAAATIEQRIVQCTLLLVR
jgi:hypothetical protein